MDAAPLQLPAKAPPLLMVVVDTEEQFDWSAPFSRQATATTALCRIERFQEICDQRGVRPAYVVDYPVADQPEQAAPLIAFAREGRAAIGAHLHPWVTPPFEEALTPANSFPGNLPAALEAAKLARLSERIAETFGAPPRFYKAGRYGRGPNTDAILEARGFEADLSPAPPFDFGDQGGPDFSAWDNHPRWFGTERRLLRLPTTGAYVGLAGRWPRLAHRLFALARAPLPLRLHLPGILSRLGVIDRLRLSPEGHELADLIRLSRFLIARGQKILTLSLHSPSLAPGHTPYVRDEAELERFVHVIADYLDYAVGELGAVMMTPLEVKRRLESPP